jgi:hypothetical protein
MKHDWHFDLSAALLICPCLYTDLRRILCYSSTTENHRCVSLLWNVTTAHVMPVSLVNYDSIRPADSQYT